MHFHCSASSVILDLVNVNEYDASHAEVDLAIGKISLSLCMGDRQSKNLADTVCCAVDVVPCSVRNRSSVSVGIFIFVHAVTALNDCISSHTHGLACFNNHGIV
jgi:hypothetical protein